MVELLDNNMQMMAVLATFVGIGFIVFILNKLRDSKKPHYRYPPSIPSVPILGSLPFMFKYGENFHLIFTEKSKSLGKVFSFYAGSMFAVVLNDRKSIQEAFVRRGAEFSDRPNFINMRFYYNKNLKGIFEKQYGSDFKKTHQMMLSVLKEFGFGQMEMEERIIREVEELLQHIAETNAQPFYPSQKISLCTLNIVASILFGKRIEQTHPALEQLHFDIHQISSNKQLPMNLCPPLRFLPKFQRSVQKLYKHFERQLKFIEDGIEKSLKDENSDYSFIRGFLAKVEPEFDREELKWLCRDLLVAGSETTASTIQWAMVLLVNNPKIQQSLQDEIDSVVPKERLPCLRDIVKLPYVEATLLEIMRLKPVLPLAIPHRTSCDTQTAGFYIPKGTMVFPNIHAVHMDPEVWGDPENFRPERFLDESGNNLVGKDRIMAFSLGRRSCLGETLARQESFLLLASLLHHFDFLPPEGKESVEVTECGPITKSPSPFYVRMKPRMSSTGK